MNIRTSEIKNIFKASYKIQTGPYSIDKKSSSGLIKDCITRIYIIWG